ncbi:MAG: class I SAM-dependent methyltransferase [Candidatus Lindowbacteria bacterium]|nr:class I SAM-dependent methyltransferase [Candidatus Lindowbacteria bacterium]
MTKKAIPVGLYDYYHRNRYGNSYPNPYELYGTDPAIPVVDIRDLIEMDADTEMTIACPNNDAGNDMTLPVIESAILALICGTLRPRTIFEIGTYTGASSLLMARNTPDSTKIVTLDIQHPEEYLAELDAGIKTDGITYLNSPVANKITQIVGDSQKFDYSSYEGTMDLVLVDGNHQYSFVKKDTETALKLINDKGTIIWDDYLWSMKHPECAGVTQAVNELSKHRKCSLIAGTRFAIFTAQ